MIPMLFVVALSAAGLFSVGASAQRPVVETAQIFGTFSVIFLVCGIILQVSKIKIFPIYHLAGALISIGLIMLYRIKPELAILQLRWFVISLPVSVFFLIMLPSYKVLARYKYIFAFISLSMMLSPIFFGVERGGAKLWLKLGSLTFQPAELGKILLAIFFASYLADRYKLLSISKKKIGPLNLPDLRFIGPLALMWAMSLVILIFEKDLGSSLLFFGLFTSILYVATERPVYPVFGFLLFFIGAVAAYFIFSHIRVRVDIWLDPWLDPKGTGYQIVQSLFAIAGGGFWGRGLGYGFPNLIPAVNTDFIFSIFSEEAGLAGASALILIYLLFISYSIKISMNTENIFGKLLAFGLASALALQTFVIIGGVTKLIPMTGVTLPFVSYGGSSLLSNTLLMSLLLKIQGESG